MATLRRTGPVLPAPGTLVAPEDGTAAMLLRHVSLEAARTEVGEGIDAESFLTPEQGVGAPVTVGANQTQSLIYHDTDSDRVYVRVLFNPNTYVRI